MDEQLPQDKRVKSVAFNVADPMEKQLYDFALKPKYFSTYMKRLIQRDMENGFKVIYKDEDKSSSIVQELTKKNEELENEIKSLKSKLESIQWILNK
ncbi:hypothetical protein [Priestia megaterium]|uniref:hypothetical protein n=1 Tax=Priestia megaterium TaxID=1404 RepID=UPI0013621F83|nr:hypothetical protein [Priestia megaterium]